MDMPSPVLQESQRPFLDSPVPQPSLYIQIKTKLKFIILLLVFLLIVTLIVTIILGKKKQPTPSSVSTVTTSPATTAHTSSTTINSSSTQSTSTVDSTTTTTTISSTTTSEVKPTGCQLPLIPSYNRNRVIVAGGDSSGSSVDELNKPVALALDSKNNLFVVDANNFRVLKYRPDSKRGEIVLGHGTDRFPRAANIIGLFLDKNDLLYTCQYDANRNSQFIIWPSSSKNGTVIMNMSGRISAFTIDQDSNIYTIFGINLEIHFAPRYKDVTFKRVSGQPFINGEILTGSSSVYLDADKNLYAIDTYNYRIQKTPIDDEYSETIVEKSPLLTAIVVDCHNNLYTLDSNASLIIYNSTGDVISTMYNPIDADSWSYSIRNGQRKYIPDYFAIMILESSSKYFKKEE